MKRIIALVLASAGCAAMAAKTPATTTGAVGKTQMVGSYRIEIQVLPPEPFYTRAQANTDHASAGLLALRGAKPIQPNASSNPNHELAVKLFDPTTGRAVTYANVTIKLQRLDNLGVPTGDAQTVPVVVMQDIGQGSQSTHYGNNVRLAPGRYRVMVRVDGEEAAFRVAV